MACPENTWTFKAQAFKLEKKRWKSDEPSCSYQTMSSFGFWDCEGLALLFQETMKISTFYSDFAPWMLMSELLWWIADGRGTAGMLPHSYTKDFASWVVKMACDPYIVLKDHPGSFCSQWKEIGISRAWLISPALDISARRVECSSPKIKEKVEQHWFEFGELTFSYLCQIKWIVPAIFSLKHS